MMKDEPRVEVKPGDLASLLARVREIIERNGDDWETVHSEIDGALYRYVDSDELYDLIEPLTFWYA